MATDEPKGRSLRCVQFTILLQIDPERRPRLGITQFDLGGLYARRRELHVGLSVAVRVGFDRRRRYNEAPPCR